MEVIMHKRKLKGCIIQNYVRLYGIDIACIHIHPPMHMGRTHYTPYFIYTAIKLTSFTNLINFAWKHSNPALHAYRIYVLCKIKYPIASAGLQLCPGPDSLIQRYNPGNSPFPQEIPDPPLVSVALTLVIQ